MFKQVVTTVFVIGLIADISQSSLVKSLVSKAEEELDNLKDLVFGQISVANSTLKTFQSDMNTYGRDVATRGQNLIDEESNRINNDLQVIKDLAASYKLDIATCLLVEGKLNALPDNITTQLNNCIADIIDENHGKVGVVIRSAMIVIQTQNDKVIDLENQLHSCNGNILCVAPIVTAIEMDAAEVPERIQIEVNNAAEAMEGLKITINDCQSANVAQYSSEANSILKDIAQCADRIM